MTDDLLILVEDEDRPLIWVGGSRKDRTVGRFELVNGEDIHDDPRCEDDGQGCCLWDGEEITERFASCSACGARFEEGDERAEVVNRTTGVHSVVHVEHYLADQCCYALA
jgi:hypothetical protein